ncbi:restriction endonuclease [Kribbella sp. NPDC055110]
MAVIAAGRVAGFLQHGDVASSTTAKGRALEDAVAYLFGRMPGLTLFARDEIDVFGCAEVDLCFSNDHLKSQLGFLDWGLIIECKNLARPVGSADVDYFRTRLRDKGARSGLLVAAGGLTGGQGTHAFHAIETALSDGVHILVLTREEIERVRTTQELAGLLLGRYMELKSRGTLTL